MKKLKCECTEVSDLGRIELTEMGKLELTELGSPEMFTRRHYVRIAEALKDLRDSAMAQDDWDMVRAIEKVVDKLVRVFKADNYRFDEYRFRKFIGV